VQPTARPAYTLRVESIKIIFGCIVAAVLYGIVHDQFTARICVEYFTEFHPPVFATQSPTLLALGWGVIATWWAGAFIGLLLAVAARFGRRPKISANDIAPMVLVLMGIMAACAIAAGFIGLFAAPVPPAIANMLPPAMHRRFLAAWWAHSASYLSGFAGGLVLCTLIWLRRGRLPIQHPSAPASTSNP
jgi:hypothetical protein